MRGLSQWHGLPYLLLLLLNLFNLGLARSLSKRGDQSTSITCDISGGHFLCPLSVDDQSFKHVLFDAGSCMLWVNALWTRAAAPEGDTRDFFDIKCRPGIDVYATYSAPVSNTTFTKLMTNVQSDFNDKKGPTTTYNYSRTQGATQRRE